ncbi:MAG: acyl-CoA dehydrogenase family protein [Acidimicrobiia bacterium]
MQLDDAMLQHIGDRADAYDASGEYPLASMHDLRDAGWFALLVPHRLGGLGATFERYCEVARALGSRCGSTALSFNMHSAVVGALATVPAPLREAMAPSALAAIDRWLAAAAQGALFQVALSERSAGSRLDHLDARYWPERGGWRVAGRKSFCTGIEHADELLVGARNAEGAASMFLVPTKQGVTVNERWDSIAMRATASHDAVIDTWVPAESLIGGIEGIAAAVANSMPQWLVSSYAAVYVGLADAALRCARAAEHLDRRTESGAARIGRAEASTFAAWLAVREAARLVDVGPGEAATNRAVYCAKLLAGDNAMAVAASMLEVIGSAGLRRGSRIERVFRDARCGALQPATSDDCALWLGREEQSQ